MTKARQVTGPSEPQIVLKLMSISKSIRALQGMKLAEIGYFRGQDELLMAATESGTFITELANALAIRPATLTKMLDRLVAKGLMSRQVSIKDRRQTSARITPAGIEARTQMLMARDELETYLTKDFHPDQLSSMMESVVESKTILTQKLNRLR